MFVSLSSLSTDQLESCRVLVNVLLFISTFAVIVGVYFESEGFPDDVKEYGWRTVVRGIAGELLFAIVLFGFDLEISSRQRSEIVELEALVAGRQLSPALTESIAAELMAFSGKKLYIVSYSGDAEAARLGMQIKAALEMAGIQVFNHLGRATAGPGGVTFGVEVSSLPTADNFSNALIKAIGRDGKIQVSDKIVASSIRMEEDSTTGIMVALRPLQ